MDLTGNQQKVRREDGKEFIADVGDPDESDLGR